MKTYIQGVSTANTCNSLCGLLSKNENKDVFAAFAYARISGVAHLLRQPVFSTKNNKSDRRFRWIVGIDYGRTQPPALKKIASLRNHELRVFDGEYVVQAKGFQPRTDYHMKTTILHKRDSLPTHQLVGSGNLSYSGLVSNYEAGAVLNLKKKSKESRARLASEIEALWGLSTPLDKISKTYAKRWEENREKVVSTSPVASTGYWVEIGYVTKNRGNKPGNQFVLPRGSHEYLGIPKKVFTVKNTLIGQLTFITPSGTEVTRNLMYNDNSMEKVTLPIPETHGYGSYDGKVLVFERSNGKLILSAHEVDDFDKLYSNRIASVFSMKSGRQFGTIG